MLFKISYNAGIGDFDFIGIGSLDDAKKIALKYNSAPKADIHIYNECDDLISVSRWVECVPNKYNDPISVYAGVGFYDHWLDL